MPDSSDIDSALIAKLGSDTALLALMPDNVWLDEAPEKSKRFVIVSLVDEADARRFEGRSHEDALYLVKAVALSTVSGANVSAKSAAARIDALLDGGTLTVTGYGLMAMYREGRLTPQVEPDQVDASIRWYHRGGHYRIVMST